jgi:hypothetical protein
MPYRTRSVEAEPYNILQMLTSNSVRYNYSKLTEMPSLEKIYGLHFSGKAYEINISTRLADAKFNFVGIYILLHMNISWWEKFHHPRYIQQFKTLIWFRNPCLANSLICVSGGSMRLIIVRYVYLGLFTHILYLLNHEN